MGENDLKVRDYWEVRQGKEVLLGSPIPYLGYPSRILLDMYASGLSIYKNGVKLKKCQLTSV